jgi:UDP-N-acetylmuramate: L-alanyl-gamma-D-glutamyl-meso-diaminopimelate ligase
MQQFHFIAIGGAVMHQLAIMLLQQGNRISGSDDTIFEPALSNLAKAGILPPAYGWFPEKIHKDLDAVVLGMHAKGDNPELLRAKELGIKIYSFPEFIFQHAQNKQRIVVAGSHGKTTTTSMIMHILKENGRAFDYLVGAKIEGFDNMVQVSDAPLMVIEGDEYLTSPLDLRSKFLHYYPDIAILTGIAWDHINVFPTYEGYLETFRQFIATIAKGGYLIYNSEDKEAEKLAKEAPEHLHIIPYSPIKATNMEHATRIHEDGKDYDLQIFGKHNMSNLSAALEVCALLNISKDDALRSAAMFSGAAKRLEKIIDFPERKLTVFRDFAHAPSKVKATVEAVKQKYQQRKVVAILELHTYSSLQDNFLPQYAHTLDPADMAIVFLDEEAFRIKGQTILSAEKVMHDLGRPDLRIVYDKNSLEELLRHEPGENVTFVFMSSGNFGGFNPLSHWKAPH